MNFLAGFYTFTIELSNVEKALYERVKTKCSLYGNETDFNDKHTSKELEFFFAKLIAFIHSYIPDLTLIPEAPDPRLPIFKRAHAFGKDEIWGFLGDVDPRALRNTLKSVRDITIALYFYSPEQIHTFCQNIRGTTENWVAGIHFYYIEPRLIHWLCEHKPIPTHWDVMITDNSSIFLTIEDDSYTADIISLDIWSEYQKSLNRDRIAQKQAP